MTANATNLTLRDTILGASTIARRSVTITAGAALIALFAQISIPLSFTPVPITGQTFAVLLVGTALGATDGTASAGVYVLAGALGAPVYANHAHGWDVIRSPSGGYLLGFIIAATVTGSLAQQGWDRKLSTSIGAMLSGNVVIYLIGIPWLAQQLGISISKALELGLYPFVAGDILKTYLAAGALPAAWRLAQRQNARE